MQEQSDTDGKTYTVQYFERAVFELHPELASPDDVLVSSLGTFQYAHKYPNGAPNQKASTSARAQHFAQTGHTIGGRFLQYWTENGGLVQQGYPISDEFTEVSGLDGKAYTVQYFERAVFELHPENRAPYDVLLSQLGTLRYQAKYPTAASTPAPAGTISSKALAYLNAALDALQANAIAGADADWSTLRHSVVAFAETVDAQTPADTYSAIRYALTLLGDAHGSFATPEQVKQETAGQQPQAQIGLSVSFEGRGVTAVMTGSLAEQAGIKVGDTVDEINGVSTDGTDISSFFSQLFSGSHVNLTLRRPGDVQAIHTNIDHSEVDPSAVPHGRLLAAGVGYIAVPYVLTSSPIVSEYANIAQQIIREIDQVPTCGWVVDLQRDEGGDLYPMVAGVGPILGEGKAGEFISPDGDKQSWYYRDGTALFQDNVIAQVDNPYQLKNPMPPVAVLTGHSTISAGEATAISFRGRVGARSFGTPTYGVPNSPKGISLSDGARLGVAYAREADRTGHIYRYNENLQPDEVVRTRAGNPLTGTDNDPVVKAGLAWLQTQPVCTR
jgi:C-terminal processing protease CtpA/Prc